MATVFPPTRGRGSARGRRSVADEDGRLRAQGRPGGRRRCRVPRLISRYGTWWLK